MTGTREDIIQYRLRRALDTFEDAEILAKNQKWNSAINRLYYSVYYAVSALLLSSNLKTTTHNGVKYSFNEHFIKTERLPKELGKLYSQLFSFRQKGDYDDLYDFNQEKVESFFEPAKKMIGTIENELKQKPSSL